MPSGKALNGRSRILVLASTFPRWQGDAEPGFVFELAKRLAGEFDVIVVCPHAKGARRSERMDRVEVRRYRYAPDAWETLVNDGGIVTNLRRSRWKYLLVPGFVLSQAWCAWRILRTTRVDLVHAHWLLPQGLIASLIASRGSRLRIPYVVTSHGADLFALRGSLFALGKRHVMRRAAMVTVVSEGMRDEALRFGVSASRLRIEPMGVDLVGKFHPDVRVRRKRDALLFVGRLVEKKGLRHLIDALPRVLAARPEVVLLVAGFGPELEARQRQVAALGIADHVSFLGAVPQHELPRLYREASAFIAPFVEASGGDQEGLGLVTLEALGCGCPAIVSSLPATRSLAMACRDVHVVAPGDPGLLAARIVEVLGEPPPEHVEGIENYDWEVRAAAYARLFHGVLA